MNEHTPIVTFVGLSGTGKTTFLEKLIPALKARDLRLAVLKHDAHHFEMDKPGKDTWRFTQAGADVVAISNAEKFALVERTDRQLTLAELVARLPEVDLILTEGYKRSATKKIEIHRACLGRPLLCGDDELLAVITDEPLPTAAPQLGLDEADACADLLVRFLAQR
jgi:molybdopterin-guanine dinucleotide biosynthesis protein B